MKTTTTTHTRRRSEGETERNGEGNASEYLPRSLTYQEAAKRLNVSAITLRRWRAEGKFLAYEFSPTLVRIPIAEIERLEAEGLAVKRCSVPKEQRTVSVGNEQESWDSNTEVLLTFAGLAMQALIQCGQTMSAANQDTLAKLAFQMADKMVAVWRKGVAA